MNKSIYKIIGYSTLAIWACLTIYGLIIHDDRFYRYIFVPPLAIIFVIYKKKEKSGKRADFSILRLFFIGIVSFIIGLGLLFYICSMLSAYYS